MRIDCLQRSRESPRARLRLLRHYASTVRENARSARVRDARHAKREHVRMRSRRFEACFIA